MKNKGLIISLVVFAGILVMLLVTIFLINFPDSSSIDTMKKKKIETVRPTIEENEKETEKKQDMGYSIAHYIYTDNMDIDIEYPVVYGMDNELYEKNINQKINIDATAIMLLHEDKDKIESLDINCTVQSFDEKEIVITYEGEMNYKSTTTQKATSTTKNNNSTAKKSSKKVSGDPNYDTYGGYSGGTIGTDSYDTYNGVQSYAPSQSQQQPVQNNNYDTYAPISGQNNINAAPISNDGFVTGFASTKVTSKKIFYTSTVNLEECKDVYLSQYTIISELAKYALSDDSEFVNVDDSKVNSVRKYIQKLGQTTIQNILQNADYQNIGLTSWPKSFSYKKNNYIYFTLPLSSELGDYVIVKYEYFEK